VVEIDRRAQRRMTDENVSIYRLHIDVRLIEKNCTVSLVANKNLPQSKKRTRKLETRKEALSKKFMIKTKQFMFNPCRSYN
jgi:hypothetical protein